MLFRSSAFLGQLRLDRRREVDLLVAPALMARGRCVGGDRTGGQASPGDLLPVQVEDEPIVVVDGQGKLGDPERVFAEVKDFAEIVGRPPGWQGGLDGVHAEAERAVALLAGKC